MRIAFAGTPDFSVHALHALHAAGHDVALVFSQPDRPAGRGRRLTPSPVSQAAEALGLALHRPARFDAAAVDLLREADVECMVVVAYGLILPQSALDTPTRGCLNIHASLLPRWRGAAPIQRAIAAGDAETGICIMQMEAGLDTGPVWRRAAVPIGENDTAADLHDRLAKLGAEEIVASLEDIGNPVLRPRPQSEEGVTYAHKLSKEEARIDWALPATDIVRRIRAYNPAPVAWTQCDDSRLRVFSARTREPAETHAPPGQVLTASSGGITVAAHRGTVELLEVQWPGGRVVPAAQLAARLDHRLLQ